MRRPKLEFKNGVGAQKQLWFCDILVTSGGRALVPECFSTARSVLDMAGVDYDWQHETAKGRSNKFEGCVIESQAGMKHSNWPQDRP